MTEKEQAAVEYWNSQHLDRPADSATYEPEEATSAFRFGAAYRLTVSGQTVGFLDVEARDVDFMQTLRTASRALSAAHDHLVFENKTHTRTYRLVVDALGFVSDALDTREVCACRVEEVQR